MPVSKNRHMLYTESSGNMGKMTKEEYIARMNEDHEWAPGWDAIDAEFTRLYPGVKQEHYATDFAKRAMFGGDRFLDGYSLFDSGKGWFHIVTFGMSELYTDKEAYGQEYSKWGYEMTMKLKADRHEDCLWALDMMSSLARYTYRSKRYFDPGECIPGNGTSLHIGTDSKITALITAADTSAQTQDTVHGILGFVQLVGITEEELQAIRKDPGRIPELIGKMKAENPDLVTDMDRTVSYIHEEDSMGKPEYLYEAENCPCPRGEKAGCPRYRQCDACIAFHHNNTSSPNTACKKKAVQEYGEDIRKLFKI